MIVGPLPAADQQTVDNDETGDVDPDGLPVTHEAFLGGHNRLITAIDVEHSGSRVVTGSYDYCVRIYDFNGMKNDMQSFRYVQFIIRNICALS